MARTSSLKPGGRTVSRTPRKRLEKPANDADGEIVHVTGCGAVLRTYREKRHLTLNVVANRLGINKSTLQRYETNESPLSDQMIDRIAKALGAKPSQLSLDCLFALRPKLKGSPFGKLLAQATENYG